MKREWASYLDTLSDEDELHWSFYETDEETWKNFRRIRPVTAHLLEELFGESNAKEHLKHLDTSFTERKAVRLVSYVYNSPIKITQPDKYKRSRKMLEVKRKE